jgi:lysophospholipase L1-like esterase
MSERILSAICLILTLVASAAPAQTTSTESVTTASQAKAWPDPNRFEKEIAAFETTTPVKLGGIVAYGSSSMRGWHKYIAEDLAPLTIVPRGFGGSNMNDALYFTDRVVLPVKPRAVLLYEGDNDIAGGHSVDETFGKYQQFVAKMHAALPTTRIYILSIKPSPSRSKQWPAAQELNARLQQMAKADPLITYIDVATPMLTSQGGLRDEIYLSDKLHMKREGYEIWRDAVRPVLMKTELAQEPDKN